MRTADWSRFLADHPVLGPALRDPQPQEWRSVPYEARPVLLAGSYCATPRRVLVITSTYEKVLQWQAKLTLCGVPGEDVCQLPSGMSALFEDCSPEHTALSDRLGALRALATDTRRIVIATPQAALERTLPKEVLIGAFLELKVGAEAAPRDIVKHLRTLGYEPQEPVRIPGQYSLRGGILDVFATGRELPVRLEFFGDQIESMRAFDPNSQRSVAPIQRLDLSPSRETLYTSHDPGLADLLLQTMEREAAALTEEEALRLEEFVRGDLGALNDGVFFDRLDLYRPLLFPESGCAIDYLVDGDLLVLDEPLELESVGARAEEELGEALKARADRGEILSSTSLDFLLPPEHLAKFPSLTMSAMNDLPSWLSPTSANDFGGATLEPYRGRAHELANTLKQYLTSGLTVVFATDQPTRAKAVLKNMEVFPSEERLRAWEHGTALSLGNLGGGFVFPSLGFAVVTDAELFGVARLRMPQKRFMEGAPIATLLDLKPGDYVVHINFGIGIFRGLVKRDHHGVEREFLFIEYRAPDKLFVPADQLDRIQKYLNPGDEHPSLNRLTGGEWQRTLGKAKEDAREFARDLIQLYASRRAVDRRPCGPDTPWQSELEATFPWVETPGQIAAIREAKQDLEKEFPMDRLVCGDVGFGKTEVAIRAVFKVIQESRQAAVLCPTTILSEQHFRNFEERLNPFGTRMALLNRFRTPAERRDILAKLKSGDIDVVIGTHSILNAKMEFKDLGMVVVDEEQKFGVKQKEALKKLRTVVDVLTLSATPIPRTLSMALLDVRQMSLINDPPPGRLPIRTFVRPYSAEVAREAILRELSRGGQVFYVYNRVQGIAHVAERLRKLVPTARIGVGHGQMTEGDLEPVMIGFIKGEIDILLSTTIIENGIDISNANTLIVENADRLGLAQLYQLRGRVGRSDRQAYAYLLHQGGRDLTEGALQRLEALQEFSALGSGYSLAFRDLQIRGAGELLGAKQHGAMAAVGYELYTQLIDAAVQTLKSGVDGVPATEAADPLAGITPLPSFDIPVEAFLPDTYIKDQAQRLYFYQKMMTSRAIEDLGACQAEVEDRYGRLPAPASNAFSVMVHRLFARDLGIEKLEAKGGRLSVAFTNRRAQPPRVWSILSKRNRECYLTGESFIWPFTGTPLRAIEAMLDNFRDALRQVEAERASFAERN